MEVWDFLYQQKGPILPVKVADYPLLCMKVREEGMETTVTQIDGTGKMICAGAGDGTTSILRCGIGRQPSSSSSSGWMTV